MARNRSEKALPPTKVDGRGNKYWRRGGKLHRDDGPAIEWADGSKEWYRDGKRHREDGPAVEWASGDKEWWRDGVFIREERG